MSAWVLCHMDASDTIIYVSQKAQTVPGHGKATPVGLPCVRPQSNMRCYRLGRCDLESGSRQKRTASENPEVIASKRGKKSSSEGPTPGDTSAELCPQGGQPSSEP